MARNGSAVTDVTGALDDDVRLHEALTGGDGGALAEVYDAHARAVYGLARHITGDPAAAEAVTQDVFVELWRRPDRFDPRRGSLRAWLCTLARRHAVDRVRRGGGPGDDRSLPAAAAGGRRIGRVLDDLPEIYRDPVVLAYYRGLSYRDVARALAIAEDAAKTRLRTGLRLIADAVSAA
jgi:RNA polymerase sigma-70 factor (ECF subfamily)